MSRITIAPVAVRLSARVVGTPRLCIASLHMNSRTDERNTARPSAVREYGVSPAPFSCRSNLLPSGIDDFGERDRAAIAELPCPVAELMAAVARRIRLHAG